MSRATDGLRYTRRPSASSTAIRSLECSTIASKRTRLRSAAADAVRCNVRRPDHMTKTTTARAMTPIATMAAMPSVVEQRGSCLHARHAHIHVSVSC